MGDFTKGIRVIIDNAVVEETKILRAERDELGLALENLTADRERTIIENNALRQQVADAERERDAYRELLQEGVRRCDDLTGSFWMTKRDGVVTFGCEECGAEVVGGAEPVTSDDMGCDSDCDRRAAVGWIAKAETMLSPAAAEPSEGGTR